MNHIARVALLGAFNLMLAGCGRGNDPATAQSAEATSSVEGEWRHIGNGTNEQHFSTLKVINDTNVAGLAPAWVFEYDTRRGQEGQPLMIDGVLYVSTAWSKVYALEAGTGKQLWQYDPKVPGAAGPKGCCDVVSRGVAYDQGRIYVATYDGRLAAVDAKTGTEIWNVNTVVDPSKPYTITGAPRVAKGKVFIGNAGAESGVRGYVTAYDAATGAKVWRFYTVPGEPGKKDGEVSDDILEEKTRDTWSGDWWKLGGGGTVWDAIVYDADLDQLYLGVGNGGPHSHYKRSEGKGDNLFLASVVAVNPDTGKYLWHYQETPADSWDFTAVQPMILTNLKIEGADRKVILHAPKNGFFYVIDRTTGVPVSARAYVDDIRWAKGIDPKTWRPIDAEGSRYVDKPFLNSPHVAGAHNWHPMAYSPLTGLVYLPTSQNYWNFAANAPPPHSGGAAVPPIAGNQMPQTRQLPAGARPGHGRAALARGCERLEARRGRRRRARHRRQSRVPGTRRHPRRVPRDQGRHRRSAVAHGYAECGDGGADHVSRERRAVRGGVHRRWWRRCAEHGIGESAARAAARTDARVQARRHREAAGSATARGTRDGSEGEVRCGARGSRAAPLRAVRFVPRRDGDAEQRDPRSAAFTDPVGFGHLAQGRS